MKLEIPCCRTTAAGGGLGAKAAPEDLRKDEGNAHEKRSPQGVVQVRGLAQLLQHAQHALQAMLLALLCCDDHVGRHLRQRICQLAAGRPGGGMSLLLTGMDTALTGAHQDSGVAQPCFSSDVHCHLRQRVCQLAAGCPRGGMRLLLMSMDSLVNGVRHNAGILNPAFAAIIALQPGVSKSLKMSL